MPESSHRRNERLRLEAEGGESFAELRNRVRRQRFKRSKRCRYCSLRIPRQRFMTLDHVVPLSRSDTHAEDNLIACCRRCNREKGNRTLAEWRYHLKRQYDGVIRCLIAPGEM